MKENVSAADSAFEDLDYNKVDKALKSIGVSLKDTNGQFRDIDDVFLEVSEKWDTLDRNSQRYVATIAAGSRQLSRFIALMENYDRTMELIEVAQDSAGRSSEQFAKYQDTLENKVKRLKNSWEQLKLSFLSSDMFKDAIDIFNNLVTGISKMDKKKLAGIAVIGMTAGKAVVLNFVNAIKGSTSLIMSGVNAVTSKITNILTKDTSNKIILAISTPVRNAMTKLGYEIATAINIPTEKVNDETALLITKYILLLQEIDKCQKEIDDNTREEQEHNEALRKKILLEGLLLATQQKISENTNHYGPVVGRNLTLVARGQIGGDLGNKAQTLSLSGPVASGLKTGLSSGISSAITTGLMMALGGADFKEILITSGSSALVSALPAILNGALPAIGKWITGTAGPVIAGALGTIAPVLIGIAAPIIVALITKKIIDSNDIEKKLKEKIKKLEKDLEEDRLNTADVESKTSDSRDELERITDVLKKYEELSIIKNKTAELQEEYNSLVETIKEEYPELIASLNEETGEIEILNKLLKELVELIKKKNLKNEQKLYASKVETAETDYALEMAKLDEKAVKYSGKMEAALDTINSLYFYGFSSDYVKKMKDWKEEDYRSDIIGTILGYGSNYQVAEGDLERAIQQVSAWNDTIEKYEKELENYEDKLDDINTKTLELTEKYAETKKNNYKDYVAGFGESEAITDFIVESTYTPNADVTEYLEDTTGLIDNYDDFITEIKSTYYEDLSDEMRAALRSGFGKSGKGTKKEFNQLIKDKDYYAIWQNYIDGVRNIYQQELGEDLWKQLTEEEKVNYTEFANTLGQYSQEELSKIDYMQFGGEESELGTYVAGKIKEEREEAARILTGTDDEHKINMLDILGLNIDEGTEMIDTWSTDAISALSNSLQKIVDITGDEQYAKTYAKNLKELFEDNEIDMTNMAKIFNTIDFTQASASNWESFRQNAILDIVELNLPGLGKEAATKFFDGWADISQNAKIFSTGFSSTLEVQTYEEQVKSISDTFVGSQSYFEQFFKTLQNYIEAEQADVITLEDELNKLAEVGVNVGNIDDYWDTNADGQIIINAEKMRSLYEDNLTIQRELTREKYKLAKLDRDSLKIELDKKKEELKTASDGPAKEGLKKTVEYLDTAYHAYDGIEEQYRESMKLISEMEDGHKRWIKNVSKIDYSSIMSLVKSLSSVYKSMADEIRENGTVSSDSVVSLDESLEALKASAIAAGISVEGGFKNAPNFLNNTKNGIQLNQQALESYIDTIIKELEAEMTANKIKMKENAILLLQLKAMKAEWAAQKQAVEEANEEAWKTYNEEVQSAYEEWQDALETIKEKEEAVAEAEQEVIEKEEELIEKEKELNELYYGTENHKNQLDFLYNYTTELEQLETKAQKAAEALEDLAPDDDVHQRVEDYKDALAEQIGNYKAQNEVIEQYIENQKQLLESGLSQRLEELKAEGAIDTSTNVSDFWYEQDGRFYIDYSKLNAANLPDDVSDFIEEQVDNMNNYAKAYEDNLDKIEQARKDFESKQKAARDKYIEVENKVVELLEKKDLEELDNLKDKYSDMKEADDDYTSALEESIKKQRDLRNQANQWDDLAEKEKKLNLMQRDTSGANAKETKKLQEDITKTRENLLDSAVDNIVNNLKELYAEQEETRQAEIEYRQAILDNKNYVDEATAIINNWENAQDALDFFMEMDEQFNEASDATFSKLVDDVNQYYQESVFYYEMAGQDFEQIVENSNNYAQDKVRETSETLTSETDRALDETMDNIHEAQEQGRREVEEAKKAVEDAKKAVVDATQAVADALEEARKKQEAYNQAIANQPTSPGNDNGGNPEPPNYKYEPNENNDPNKPSELNYDVNQLMGQYFASHPPISKTVILDVIDWVKQGNGTVSFSDVIQYIKEHISESKHGYWDNIAAYYTDDIPQWARNAGQVFKTGGLVNYTGPAWVDGTPSSPEAFLSAEDTRRISALTDILSEVSFLDLTPQATNTTFSNSVGDLAFNININVENITSDYDVDQMVERIQEDIISITNEAGTPVFLHK